MNTVNSASIINNYDNTNNDSVTTNGENITNNDIIVKVKKKRNRKKKPPYVCIRCNYSTLLKTDMRKHLYDTKNICQGIANDIELIDTVKEYILANRTYKIPKPEKKIISKPEKKIEYRFIEMTISISINYVYLVWPKEYIRTNEPIYKTGNTVTKQNHVNLQRLTSYGIGSKVLLLLECDDALNMERVILEKFNIEFERHIFGTEFFVGDKKKMMQIMMECVMNENK